MSEQSPLYHIVADPKVNKELLYQLAIEAQHSELLASFSDRDTMR